MKVQYEDLFLIWMLCLNSLIIHVGGSGGD